MFDPARTLIEEAGLPAKYWDFAVDVAYVKNRLYHAALNTSPFAILYPDKEVKLHHLRLFGCGTFDYNEHRSSTRHSLSKALARVIME